MGRIEDKILDILNKNTINEAVEYEIVGGPSPSETLKAPLDYAKNVKQATVPMPPAGSFDLPEVGEVGDDDADDNSNIDINSEMEESEGVDETFASLLARLAEEEDEDEDDEDEDDGEPEDVKEDEGGETSLKSDNGGTPDETLPDVDSKLDSPDSLVTKSPVTKVAESKTGKKKAVKESKLKEDDGGGETSLKSDNGGEPSETLPDVDSLLDSPDKLATAAPGAKTPDTKVAEGEGDDDEDDDEDKEDVEEDINAIFAGAGISEAAKAKATTIFKAAVASRVNEEKRRVQKVATKKLTEAYGVLKTRTEKKNQVFEGKLTTQVDRYLNYVVENWMKENRLAVERGIRAELAEDFINGLKTLFVEHYIEVPESKVDVVATLGKKVTKLEAKLNETTESNIKMRSSLNAYRKEEVLRATSAGLADTQREKLKKLAEGVEYTTRKEFAEKLSSLKESYFPKAAKPKKEEPLMEAATKTKPAEGSEMAQYTSTISRMKKN